MNVVSVACEDRMRLDGDVQVKVSLRTLIESRRALAGQTQLLSATDSGRDLDVDLLDTILFLQGQFLFRPEYGFFQCNRKVILDILTFSGHLAVLPAPSEKIGKGIIATVLTVGGVGASATPPGGICAGGSAAAESPESEFPQDVVQVEVPENILLAVALPEGIRPEAVVLLAFFLVAQDGIGFADLLEFLFRLLVSGIAVRMEFHGELPVRFLDFLFGRALFNAQRLVVIFCHWAPRKCSNFLRFWLKNTHQFENVKT